VKDARHVLTPPAEAFLLLAARAQVAGGVVLPALARGQWVVCDRWADSTLAYQGYGRGLPLALLREANHLAAGALVRPSLAILLDLPPEEAVRRRPPSPHDPFETAGLGFLRRVREGYVALAGEEPERWLVVDATLPVPTIAALVWERVRRLLAGEEGLAPPRPSPL
jgi:dTMP kinase